MFTFDGYYACNVALNADGTLAWNGTHIQMLASQGYTPYPLGDLEGGRIFTEFVTASQPLQIFCYNTSNNGLPCTNYGDAGLNPSNGGVEAITGKSFVPITRTDINNGRGLLLYSADAGGTSIIHQLFTVDPLNGTLISSVEYGTDQSTLPLGPVLALDAGGSGSGVHIACTMIWVGTLNCFELLNLIELTE